MVLNFFACFEGFTNEMIKGKKGYLFNIIQVIKKVNIMALIYTIFIPFIGKDSQAVDKIKFLFNILLSGFCKLVLQEKAFFFVGGVGRPGISEVGEPSGSLSTQPRNKQKVSFLKTAREIINIADVTQLFLKYHKTHKRLSYGY